MTTYVLIGFQTPGTGPAIIPASVQQGDKILNVINLSATPPTDITVDFGPIIPENGFIAQPVNVTTVNNCIALLQRG